jgi:heme-degrading monooxygenase HmoA
MSEIATTPKPPYYAVIFTSVKTGEDNGYQKMSETMVLLAKEQPGFLGIEDARSHLGITVSYWSDLVSIQAWKQNAQHLIAQQKGRDYWYDAFKVRISKVKHDYNFSKMLE